MANLFWVIFMIAATVHQFGIIFCEEWISDEETTEYQYADSDETTEKWMQRELTTEPTKLQISNQNLTALDDSYWASDDQIITIDASNNPIEKVAILCSDNIEEITLRYGNLRWLRRGSFIGIKKLRALDFSYNIHLTTVDLSSNTLEIVNASYCAISDFSLETENLKRIDLSHNRIEKISSDSFSTSTRLEYLDLSHNRIKEIEELSFLKTTSLVYLDVSNNLIEQITDWTIPLRKSVEKINLSYNKIESIDLLYLRETTVLNVSFNSLREIPHDLHRLLPIIGHLDASGNPVRKIITIDAPKLIALQLRECKLTEIAPGAFHKTLHLEHLDLTDNKIANLEFVLSLGNQSAAILDENPWRCFCNFSLTLRVVCQPDNLPLAEYCAVQLEASSLDDRWFRELVNPAIWAPILLAMVILVVACTGFGIWKKRKLSRLMTHSYECVPIDLIQNVPEEEEQYRAFRLFRAFMSWQRDRQSLQSPPQSPTISSTSAF